MAKAMKHTAARKTGKTVEALLASMSRPTTPTFKNDRRARGTRAVSWQS